MVSTPLGQDITKDLNYSQTTTYLYILNQIIDNKHLTKSNKVIAKDLKLSVSTVEKHLKVLNNHGLIERENTRARNPFTLEWETVSREITIPADKIDPRILAGMHKQRIQSILDLVVTPEATRMMVKKMKESRQKIESR
ncbi:winged helix-turn-helix domain-containing protein [Mycoplasmatota bacterium WC30]